MPLTKLQFRPGIVQDLTSYSNEGGWRDGDKVRFRLGYPEKIGGWAKYTSSTFLGTCRALHNWIALDGSNYLYSASARCSPYSCSGLSHRSFSLFSFLINLMYILGISA